MPFSLIPDQIRPDIYAIDLEELQREGIRVLLADLDNTLARYSETRPSQRLLDWKEDLDRHGIRLFLLSNSRKAVRADVFCRDFIPYLKHAGKPKTGGFLRAFAENGVTAQQCAIVGDQIFTDILGGNRAGVRTILVHPVAIDNLLRALRYGAETPFRLACRDRKERV